jgi:hypothetical protein
MNINGITPNFNEPLNVKPKADTNNYTGPSFAASIKELAQSAQIQVAGGNNASLLNLNRHKEEKTEELFSFTKAEEEQAEHYIASIDKLLNKMKGGE